MAFTQSGEPALGDWIALPDFQAQQSKEGGWKATQSFQILRATLDEETFQSEFTIERPIGDLAPEVESFWQFLGLASIERAKDGIVSIPVENVRQRFLPDVSERNFRRRTARVNVVKTDVDFLLR